MSNESPPIERLPEGLYEGFSSVDLDAGIADIDDFPAMRTCFRHSWSLTLWTDRFHYTIASNGVFDEPLCMDRAERD